MEPREFLLSVLKRLLSKDEALAIEPSHDPQGIVSEAASGCRCASRTLFFFVSAGRNHRQAMQLVVRYGDKIWDKFPEPPDNASGGLTSYGLYTAL